jgi:hypothetical protein
MDLDEPYTCVQRFLCGDFFWGWSMAKTFDGGQTHVESEPHSCFPIRDPSLMCPEEFSCE